MSHDPEYLQSMLEASEKYDLVLGSRSCRWRDAELGSAPSVAQQRWECYARAVLGLPIRDLTGA